MKLLVICLTLFSILDASSMQIIGHRGACGYEPENSLISFQRAVDMGLSMIELDVHVCATGELVVIHDDTVDRTTNGRGKVMDMTFDQLRNLTIAGQHQIPTLEEVIDLLDRKVSLNIELKGLGTAVAVAELLKKYLKRGWKVSDFVVSSFDHPQIDIFHQILPEVKIGVLFHTTAKDKLRTWLKGWVPDTVLNYMLSRDPDNLVQVAQLYHANFIGVGVNAVTSEIVSTAHQAGYPIFVWTVNNKKVADELRAMKVDGVFSDYPDKVRALA